MHVRYLCRVQNAIGAPAAGLGEFRTVHRAAGQRKGGGKIRPDDPNLSELLRWAIP